MSDPHVTEVQPHDIRDCVTARNSESGDCGTRYVVACRCGWVQGVGSMPDALLVQGRHHETPDADVVRSSP